MLLGFVLVSVCQLAVSLIIVGLISWPTQLQLNEALLKFTPYRTNVVDEISPTATTVGQGQRVDVNESQSMNSSGLAAHRQEAPPLSNMDVQVPRGRKLEIGYKSVMCSRPTLPADVPFEMKFAGFSSNESVEDFPDTKFLLTCLSIDPNKSECACYGTTWLFIAMILAGATATSLFAQLCVYCLMVDDREQNRSQFYECCALGFSALIGFVWLGLGLALDHFVMKPWPFKYTDTAGNVEYYVYVPITWKIVVVLCYAFVGLFVLHMIMMVCSLARQAGKMENGVRVPSPEKPGDGGGNVSGKSSPVLIVLQSNVNAGRRRDQRDPRRRSGHHHAHSASQNSSSTLSTTHQQGSSQFNPSVIDVPQPQFVPPPSGLPVSKRVVQQPLKIPNQGDEIFSKQMPNASSPQKVIVKDSTPAQNLVVLLRQHPSNSKKRRRHQHKRKSGIH